MKPWDGVIPVEEQEAYRAAGFGRPTGVGRRPALLIIDVQYRTVGTEPRPFREAIKEFPTSCGEVGWAAVKNVHRLLTCFRDNGWPVLYPYVSPKETFDQGRLSDKVPAIMDIAARGYDFVAECAPQGRRAGAEEAPERLLRYAARELSGGAWRGHAGGHRLHDQRLRARHRGRRLRLQLPLPGAARLCVPAARFHTRSICST